MDRRWIELGMRAAEALAWNGAWASAMAGGAFAVALVGERVLTLALG